MPVSAPPRWFIISLAVLCLAYLGAEMFYALHAPLHPDELGVSHKVFQLAESAGGFRKLSPYKPLLGQFLLAPALWLSDDPWNGLMLLRGELVLLNTLALFAAGRLLVQHFRPAAVLLGLFLLATSTNFFERSAEIRLDMLAAWCGLFSLLLLLDRRYFWAGLICAAGFFVSQKAAYFILASNVLMLADVTWRRDRQALRDAVVFNATMAAVAILYIGTLSLLLTFDRVMHTTFTSTAIREIALSNIYQIHHLFWPETLRENPLLYGVAAVYALLQLHLLRTGQAGLRDVKLLAYSVALTALCIWHKQPWAYFFVIYLPTVAVLNVAAFDWLLPRAARWPRMWQAAAVAAAVLIAVVPLDTSDLFFRGKSSSLMPKTLFPWPRLWQNFQLSNDGQQDAIRMANEIVGPGETYVDGVGMLFRREQATPKLAWLDNAQIARLNSWEVERRDEIVDSLKAAPVKLFVYNWRTETLMEPISTYLHDTFAPLWGNLYIYAPVLKPGETYVDVKFAGTYTVLSTASVQIDGRSYRQGDVFQLTPGTHRVDAAVESRLKFVPADWSLSLTDPAEPEEGFFNLR